MRIRGLWWAAFCTISLATIGCGGGDGDGGAAPTPTPTAAPTSTPTASPFDFALLSGAVAGKAMDAPAQDTLFDCNEEELLPATQPWANNETGLIDLAASPRVPGDVTWGSLLTITTENAARAVNGNSLPDHPTGTFPVPADSEAALYDPNPNSILEQDLDWSLPGNPAIAEEPGCINLGPIAIMLTGAVLYSAIDADGITAAAEHTLDPCEGHPGINGQYHYHSYSSCLDAGADGEHSPLLGYVVDGFGIYGPRDEDGGFVSNDELDECHGHIGEAPNQEGELVTAYHYHINDEFPYTVGCYRGTPAQVSFPLHLHY